MISKNELLSYNSKDGTQLVGVLNNNPTNKNCIVMCHGLKTDKEEYGTFTYLSELFQKSRVQQF